MAYLAMTKSVENYSRAIIIFSFMFMMIFIPIEKIFIKKFLFKIGIWAKDASMGMEIIDLYLKQYLVNSYLGYKY